MHHTEKYTTADRVSRGVRRIGAHERGTVLLMVVGVLALLSIITVVYAAIGRADRVTSLATVRQFESDTVMRAIADYHAGVIRDDLFDAAVVRGWNQRAVTDLPVRETWDYPSIDPADVSDERELSADTRRFSPTGFGTDPWLASSTPIVLSGLRGGNENLDLRSLSVFAPDGRAVNLVNLRGDFTAPHGIDPGEMADSPLLYDINGDPLPEESNQRNLATPANYFSNQLHVFRPAIDVDHDPGEREYALNSFADADGDGVLDSRWWEPVDGFEERGVRQVIPADGRYRYLIASLARDLSGKINVNTAMEAFSQPTSDFPIGSTPASVDLNRVLTMADSYGTPGRLRNDEPGLSAYEGLTPRGLNLQAPVSYTGYGAGGGALASEAFLSGMDAFGAVMFARDYGRLPIANDPDYTQALYGQVAGDYSARRRYISYAALLDGVDDGTLVADVSNTGELTNQRVYFASAFGVESEVELRAFNGLNDPASHTKLERAIEGPPTDRRSQPIFDPFRSNRPFDVEREYRDTDRNGALDLASQNLLLADIRQHLTTLNGSRRLVSRPVDVQFEGGGIEAAGLPFVDPDFLIQQTEIPYPITKAVDRLTAPAPDDTQLQEVYGRYFRALAPYHRSGSQGTVVRDDDKPAYAGAIYSGNPIRVAQMAAHLTVNLADAADDSSPRSNEDTDVERRRRSTIGQLQLAPNIDESQFVWDRGVRLAFQDPLFGSGTGLAAGDWNNAEWSNQRLEHLTVYGIEAQPFVTEAVALALFTDAPDDLAGSSDDWTEAAIPGDPGVGGPVTIQFDRSETNADFLFEVIAFQLSNPFDEPIVLSNDTDSFEYYIEYSGRFYPLVDLGDPQRGLGPQPVNLAPRSSRTFYAFGFGGPNPTGIAGGRVRMAAEDPGDAITAYSGDLNTVIAEIVEAMFGANAVRTQPNTLVGMSLTPLAAGRGAVDLTPEISTIEESSVKLWRKDEISTLVNRRTDRLLDRLHDQSGSGQVLKLNFSSFDEVRSTLTGDPDVDPLDNTGFTVATFNVLRRPNLPSGTLGTNSLRGMLPPWAIDYSSDNGTIDWNVQFKVQDPLGQATFYQSPPTEFRRGYWETLADCLNDLTNSQNLQDHLQVYTGLYPDAKPASPNSLPQNRSNQSFREVAIEVQRRETRGDPLFDRPADFLLPLAIGPSRSVFEDTSDPAPTNPDEAFLERHWLTLSEALAIATDYASGPVAVGQPPESSIWFNAARRPQTGGLVGSGGLSARPFLDHGRLVIDDWAPYVDTDGDGFWDSNEPSIGAGIPMALNVLEEFAAFGPESTTDALPGLININTAPLEVLRALPMLAPRADGLAGWMPGGHDASIDAAAMLLAYRDKMNLTGTSGIFDVTGQRIDIADFTQPRAGVTGIPGLRDEPGFRSIGEILCARTVQADGTRPSPDHSVDRLGFDSTSGGFNGGFGGGSGLRINQPGIESASYDDGSGGRQVDGSEFDYDEKLAIANAVLNSINVRSDTFCVWFVVHGYRESDVTDLAVEDPMVPSIARRFMMIVDRSNVDDRTDDARILLFREVPL